MGMKSLAAIAVGSTPQFRSKIQDADIKTTKGIGHPPEYEKPETPEISA